jgi:uncharacterized membrane protein YfcA
MGIAIFAVLGIFLAIHLAAPGVTLWPSLLVALAVVTMVASHVSRKPRRPDRLGVPSGSSDG